MLAAKTDWGVDIPVVADSEDPFAGAGPVEQIGLEINLAVESPVLHGKLVDLLASESELHNRGVTCVLKDLPDSTCSACPLSKHDQPGSGIGLLCRIGREQEATTMQLHALAQDGPGS